MNRKHAAALAAGAITTGSAVAIAAATLATASHAAASTPSLVYICQAQPCRNNQELEVFDSSGAPIFSVPEYGGPAAFGDNLSVYGPASIWHPAVTVSYESPAAYDRDHGLSARCTAPSAWYEPHGTWSCTASGTWVKKASL
jgi:hypothetical protein